MIEISKDTLWKSIIEDLFDDFLYYFFPEWARNKVDFSKPFEFLDKELDEIFPTEQKQKRYADKLAKVHTKDGKEQWILLHIEVQGYKDLAFPERMFHYFYRIRERWKKEVMALTIFTDDDPNYIPSFYQYQYGETSVLYKFQTFKILEKTESELNILQNPFSIVMRVAKKALEKQAKTDSQQLVWKQVLVKELKNANYSKVRIRKILDFIRYYIGFKKEANLETLDNSIQIIFKQRKSMGIQEAILTEVKEKVTEKVTKEVTEKVTKEVTEKVTKEVTEKVTKEVTVEVTQQNKILGIKESLKLNLPIEQITAIFQVDKEFILKVQKGLLK